VTAKASLDVVVLGLSLSSSWGNGHATTYRALLSAFAERGHRVLFLEREVPWYERNRDVEDPGYCELRFYPDLAALQSWRDRIARADAVVIGSYVPDGIEVARFVQATATGIRVFYDIDTPVTLASLEHGPCDYLAPELIPGFDLYLSFTGGPMLHRLVDHYGARRAEALFCSVDADRYAPGPWAQEFDLGYLGTYSDDRQPTVERLLLETARRLPQMRFVVAGPLYPDTISWPRNVMRRDHVAPAEHRAFYGSCRFTLNVTRADMIAAGYSPSVRLFEAAACATPIISDMWPGLETLLEPGEEILITRTTENVAEILTSMPEDRRLAIGRSGRARVLASHTSRHRAAELEGKLLRLRQMTQAGMVSA